MRHRINLLAVILGLLTAIISTLFSGLCIGVSIILYARTKELPVNPASFTEYLKTTPCLLTLVFFGGIATIISGFITGWIAGHDRVTNACLMTTIVLGLNIALIPFSNTYPLWYNITSAFVMLIGGLVGGFCAKTFLPN